MIEPFQFTCVSTNDTTGAGSEVAFVPFLGSAPCNPASHPTSEADFVLRLSYETLKGCAKHSEKAVEVLWKAMRWKRVASQRGQHSISKEECTDWEELLKHEFARNGKTHIHLNRLDLGQLVVLVDEAKLTADPMLAAASIIQDHFLRPLDLGGRTKATVKRHRRLVSNPNSGGMSLEYLAAAFGKSLSWASRMRVRLEKAGWCQYRRRFTLASKIEGDIARLIGLGGPYIPTKSGKYLKERVSECTQLVCAEFRPPFNPKKPVVNSLEAYAVKKGRVCA